MSAPEETEDLARLMDAALDLYAALDALRGADEHECGWREECGPGCLFRKADAALAKARGES